MYVHVSTSNPATTPRFSANYLAIHFDICNQNFRKHCNLNNNNRTDTTMYRYNTEQEIIQIARIPNYTTVNNSIVY